MASEQRFVCCVRGDPAAGEAWDHAWVFVEEPDREDGSAGMKQDFGAHGSCLRRVFWAYVDVKDPDFR